MLTLMPQRLKHGKDHGVKDEKIRRLMMGKVMEIKF